jgi:hypothetical protein
MPMRMKTMKTMPLHMTSAMKNQFIKHSDKRASDFVTASQNPTETRESDINFLEEWTFPGPFGQCAPVNFFCTNISSDFYMIMQKGRKVYACLHGLTRDGRDWHIARVWEIHEGGYYNVVFEGMDDVRVHFHSIWLCKVNEYDGHMFKLTTMIQLFTKKFGKAATAAAPAWQSRQDKELGSQERYCPCGEPSSDQREQSPQCMSPQCLSHQLKSRAPPGDGAGAGAAEAGGPAGVGEDIEMTDGEDGSSNPFVAFIQPTNQEEYSDTSTDVGSIYLPSDDR